MKTNKLLIPVLCVVLLAASCSKDSSPAPVSADSANTTFTSVNSTLSTEVGNLNQTSGYTATQSFNDLTNINDPFSRIASFKPAQIRSQMKAGMVAIRQMLLVATGSIKVNGRVADSEPFGFSDRVGVYTWDHAKQVFTKTGESTVIEVDYPTAGATSATNDAQLLIKKYEETQLGDGSWNPTNVDVVVNVNSTKEAEYTLNVGYDDNDATNYVNASLTVDVYTITFLFDDTKATSTTLDYNFSKSGKTLIDEGGTVTYADASKQEASTLTAHIQLINVLFTATLSNANSSSSDYNDLISIVITIDGGAAGKVVWVTDDQTGDQVPYVQFNDNSKKLLSDVFADLTSQVQSLVP